MKDQYSKPSLIAVRNKFGQKGTLRGMPYPVARDLFVRMIVNLYKVKNANRII